MRIGNVEDMEKEKTEEADNLAALIQSDPEESMTKSEKAANWWYYRKWYVIGGIAAAAAIFHLVGTLLGFWTKEPDFQIAYVGNYSLPEETITSLEEGFASIAEDYNGDGEVIVQINQYSHIGQNTDSGFGYYEYGSEIPLIGDISACDSFFFLTDDPDRLQQAVQIFSDLDGNRPDDDDYSTEGKVIAWVDCPILANMELGEYISAYGYEELATTANQELLSGLYIGRRCFYNDKVSANYEKCCELWELIRNSR